MTPDHRSTILVVEDDDATRTFLADNLTADGFELLVADCARDGLRLLETKFPDLVLVDLGLPDASGFELVRRVREADGIASRIDPRTPLVLVSGRTSELDRVRGFERGCDDYVCKPFSYPELRGRVAALLRRVDGRRTLGRLRVGDLEVDPPSREVRLRGSRVELSQKEFALLRTLARRADAGLHECNPWVAAWGRLRRRARAPRGRRREAGRGRAVRSSGAAAPRRARAAQVRERLAVGVGCRTHRRRSPLQA
jgi:DNA-binding response OmpR family regulator